MLPANTLVFTSHLPFVLSIISTFCGLTASEGLWAPSYWLFQLKILPSLHGDLLGWLFLRPVTAECDWVPFSSWSLMCWHPLWESSILSIRLWFLNPCPMWPLRLDPCASPFPQQAREHLCVPCLTCTSGWEPEALPECSSRCLMSALSHHFSIMMEVATRRSSPSVLQATLHPRRLLHNFLNVLKSRSRLKGCGKGWEIVIHKSTFLQYLCLLFQLHSPLGQKFTYPFSTESLPCTL